MPAFRPRATVLFKGLVVPAAISFSATVNPAAIRPAQQSLFQRERIAMSIDTTDIEKAALLARIRLDPTAVPELTERLGNILKMVDQLQSVDTSNVTPMANPLDATQRLRADEVTETSQRERFQAIAPSTENGLYLVPRVIE